MGEDVRLPNCKEISPEASKLISTRTKESSYWARRWSEINKSLYETNPEDRDGKLIQDALQYVTDWLYERNRAALRARGF